VFLQVIIIQFYIYSSVSAGDYHSVLYLQ